MLFHFLLASIVSIEKSAVFMCAPPPPSHVSFFSDCFQDFFLTFVFNHLKTMCLFVFYVIFPVCAKILFEISVSLGLMFCCLSLILEDSWPLSLQICLSSLSLFPFYIYNYVFVRPSDIVPHLFDVWGLLFVYLGDLFHVMFGDSYYLFG